MNAYDTACFEISKRFKKVKKEDMNLTTEAIKNLASGENVPKPEWKRWKMIKAYLNNFLLTSLPTY